METEATGRGMQKRVREKVEISKHMNVVERKREREEGGEKRIIKGTKKLRSEQTKGKNIHSYLLAT